MPDAPPSKGSRPETAATDAAPPITVTVVGGYLGSGKTTLVNHVLRTADSRVAVLVNDFGDVNIDVDLITSHDGNTVELANGCICCSLVDGFASALDTIGSLSPRPERLLVEASGVADPATVAAYAHTPGFTLDAVIVLADAEAIERNVADRYVGDAVGGQLAAADVVVMNKIDLVDGSRADRVAGLLSELAPDAAIVRASHGDVPSEILFGPSPPSMLGPADHVDRSGLGVSPHLDVETWSLTVEATVARAAVEEAMVNAPEGLIRMKGVIALTDEAAPHVLQRVGRRWTLRPAVADSAASLQTGRCQIVAIGRPGTIADDWLADQFRPGQARRKLE